ncbi:hypothetical protein BDV30DRAFT_203603 [Aspergillus minisclerotigenes]|uniref:Uncharacterized protein n=1 Tax=Aspergillus minisclerotigenes TaxID=656917 RepID=A0A5N6JHA5_9EURO|nr:hypothetical protein BDV30DRAFT_203603 [Aspergillus minisclerotigenes]
MVLVLALMISWYILKSVITKIPPQEELVYMYVRHLEPSQDQSLPLLAGVVSFQSPQRQMKVGTVSANSVYGVQ